MLKYWKNPFGRELQQLQRTGILNFLKNNNAVKKEEVDQSYNLFNPQIMEFERRQGEMAIWQREQFERQMRDWQYEIIRNSYRNSVGINPEIQEERERNAISFNLARGIEAMNPLNRMALYSNMIPLNQAKFNNVMNMVNNFHYFGNQFIDVANIYRRQMMAVNYAYQG